MSVIAQNIASAKNLYNEQFGSLYTLRGASPISFEYFQAAYLELHKEAYVEENPFLDKAIFRKILQTDLCISITSTLATSELTNPFLAKGAFLDLMTASVGVIRKTDVPAIIMFEVKTSSNAYPYTISAGATIVDSNNDNKVMFELNEDFVVTQDNSLVFFTAVSPGESYNNLSDETGLVFLPRASSSDLNVATYSIYASSKGLTRESDDDLFLRYMNFFYQSSAGAKQNYFSRVIEILKEVTDVKVLNNPITDRGSVNIYITMAGGRIYTSQYLVDAKAKIYKEMPTTDNITFFYATPVSIDLTGIVVEVSSGLSDEEKNVISKKLNEYFAGNKINRNVYKSKIGCVIIDANPSKILNVTIPNLPEVTLIGETSYARPNFGAITYSIV